MEPKGFLMETNYHNAHNLAIIKNISIMNKLRLLRLLVSGKKRPSGPISFKQKKDLQVQ